MTLLDISKLSGVSPTQVRLVFNGKNKGILRVNSEAILGVKLPEEYFPDGDAYVDSTGSCRRLRALSVQGFSIGYLAKRSGLTPRTIGIVRSSGRDRVFASRRHVITKLHDLLWDLDPLEESMSPGGITRAKQHAKLKGWWPTEAWTDMDDPNCEPRLKAPRSVVMVEDFRELLQFRGVTREDAAKRIGVRLNTMEKAIERYEKAAS